MAEQGPPKETPARQEMKNSSTFTQQLPQRRGGGSAVPNKATLIVRRIRRIQQRAIEFARDAVSCPDDDSSTRLFMEATRLQNQVSEDVGILKQSLRCFDMFVIDLVDADPVRVDLSKVSVAVTTGQVSGSSVSDSCWGAIEVEGEAYPFHLIRGIMTNGGRS